MRNHIENIRIEIKKQGYTPTSQQIRDAISTVCPQAKDILKHKGAIVAEVIKVLTSSSIVPSEGVAPIEHPDSAPIETAHLEVQAPSDITVSTEEKYNLVTAQAVALGFSLSEQEAVSIADSIDNVFKDYSSFIGTITTAIKSYFDYKFDSIEQLLDSSTKELQEHISDRTTRLNNKFANVSGALKTDLGGVRQSIKSARSAILERFALQ
ncbi:hypothetical protein NIES4071_106710 (plasmid) [Calothrix sp. NIES-4071]|nr:hypothetical protein NIES4071_106710 [Calothrix sp. NIES-4071]BAZ65089.1 hypothetical protein NIES4105_108220 [Calothrix sp. NIES-4105]